MATATALAEWWVVPFDELVSGRKTTQFVRIAGCTTESECTACSGAGLGRIRPCDRYAGKHGDLHKLDIAMNKIERPFERRIDALRRTHQGMPAALNISVRQFPGRGARLPWCLRACLTECEPACQGQACR